MPYSDAWPRMGSRGGMSLSASSVPRPSTPFPPNSRQAFFSQHPAWYYHQEYFSFGGSQGKYEKKALSLSYVTRTSKSIFPCTIKNDLNYSQVILAIIFISLVSILPLEVGSFSFSTIRNITKHFFT